MRVEEYDLHLDVDYAKEEFTGDLTVTGDGAPPLLALDCEGLSVTQVWSGDTPIPFRVDPGLQQLQVEPSGDGRLTLRITYSGKVGQKTLSGMYASRQAGRTYLTTMMEPVGCRRLLPCLDRPDQKAVFRLTVTTEPGLTVISNAPVARTEERDGRRRWCFEPTPRMSTYLLYLGIGPFELRALAAGAVELVAATPPGKSAQSQACLEMGGPLLEGYAAYFGLPYPLPKLHLVAVPELGAGAMENWGAIAFSEIGLMVDGSTSPSIRRWIVETMAHEIAHQWFGNLVTMRSFTDIWLNESFATWVAAKMSERLKLREDAWSEFLIRIRPSYFTDSLESTHPIQLPSAAPADIMQNVDEITYYKGAAVLRMIDAYLGEETFRRGVSTYLARHQYGNAEGPDLWRAMEEVSQEPVGQIMRSWVERPGMPVLRARWEAGRLRLLQERFRVRGGPSTDPPWPIPLTARLDGQPLRRLFEERELDLPLADPGSLVLNPGRAAFLRVWYDPALRRGMVARIPQLAPFDRWAFLSDSYAFLLAGEYDLEDYLRAIEAASRVADYPSVMECVETLESLQRILAGDPRFDAVRRQFARAQSERLGLDARPTEPEPDAILRESVSELRVWADPAFAVELARRFDELDRSPAALRPAIAVAYGRQGAADALDRLFVRADDTRSEDSSDQAAFGLGALPDADRLGEVLARALSPGRRVTSSYAMISAVSENSVGRPLVWPWLETNLEEFRRRAEGSWYLAHLLQRILPTIGLAHPREVRAHFADHEYPEACSGIRRGLELIDVLQSAQARLRRF
ncbi:MAG: M1 family metallopeptidase [Thermoplasmata archaeon]|nr:M1 family metallopeptidase [Thermoplasmata archaeon]